MVEPSRPFFLSPDSLQPTVRETQCLLAGFRLSGACAQTPVVRATELEGGVVAIVKTWTRVARQARKD